MPDFFGSHMWAQWSGYFDPKALHHNVITMGAPLWTMKIFPSLPVWVLVLLVLIFLSLLPRSRHGTVQHTGAPYLELILMSCFLGQWANAAHVCVVHAFLWHWTIMNEIPLLTKSLSFISLLFLFLSATSFVSYWFLNEKYPCRSRR